MIDEKGAGTRAGKGAGYQDESVVGCQFSVYPLRQADIDTPVQASHPGRPSGGSSVRVGNLSTLMWGSEDEVFAALRAAFRAAQHHGPAVLMATLAAGMPTDELVGAIQADVDDAATGRNGRPARRSSLMSFKDWTTREIVVAAVLAVAVGVIFWAWGLLWSSAFQVVPFPFSYALVGVWMIGGLLVPYVVRRPGAALLGELVAAFVSMAMGNQWGILTMASGLVQGAGAEAVFAAFRWRRFTGIALYAAAALAGAFSILLDTFVYSYYVTYTWSSIGVAAILCVVSSVVLGGGLSHLLGSLLAKTGVLSGLGGGSGGAKRV